MLETVRGAVRRLLKILNSAFECDYYYYYYYDFHITSADATGNNGSALPNGETVKEERLPVLSSSELIVARKKKLAERKQKIAELATAVIESPEENVSLSAKSEQKLN